MQLVARSYCGATSCTISKGLPLYSRVSNILQSDLSTLNEIVDGVIFDQDHVDLLQIVLSVPFATDIVNLTDGNDRTLLYYAFAQNAVACVALLLDVPGLKNSLHVADHGRFLNWLSSVHRYNLIRKFKQLPVMLSE